MQRNVRCWLVGGLAAFLAVALMVVGGSRAADEKELKDAIEKLADLMAKKDLDAAKPEAEKVAKSVDDIEPVMDLMKPRKDGGFGVGGKAGAITPDGIEKKIIDLDKKGLSGAQFGAQAEALGHMANRVAAIAEVAQHKCPVKKKEGDKDPKDWQKWTAEMRQAALEVSDAAHQKNASGFNKSLRKLNETCNTCHSVFK